MDLNWDGSFLGAIYHAVRLLMIRGDHEGRPYTPRRGISVSIEKGSRCMLGEFCFARYCTGGLSRWKIRARFRQLKQPVQYLKADDDPKKGGAADSIGYFTHYIVRRVGPSFDLLLGETLPDAG